MVSEDRVVDRRLVVKGSCSYSLPLSQRHILSFQTCGVDANLAGGRPNAFWHHSTGVMATQCDVWGSMIVTYLLKTAADFCNILLLQHKRIGAARWEAAVICAGFSSFYLEWVQCCIIAILWSACASSENIKFKLNSWDVFSQARDALTFK